MFQDWGIQVDSIKASYALQLNAFDGKPLPPLYLVANPPNMLPTVILTGVNVSLRHIGLTLRYKPVTDRKDLCSTTGYGSGVQAFVGRGRRGREAPKAIGSHLSTRRWECPGCCRVDRSGALDDDRFDGAISGERFGWR
jgi:hypothetical protein